MMKKLKTARDWILYKLIMTNIISLGNKCISPKDGEPFKFTIRGITTPKYIKDVLEKKTGVKVEIIDQRTK